MKDPYYQTYRRLKKYSKKGRIKYLKALESLIERPFIDRGGMSGPEIFEKLEMLGKIYVWGEVIFIN